MTSLLAAALRYAELGYRVFPCAPGRKTPLTRAGFQDGTTDSASITQWWQQWPHANVAIATEGLLVVDVDGADNPWLAEEPERLLELAQGAVAITPRGGHHYVFGLPEGMTVRSQVGKLAPKVDIRAHGAYILVAPSVIGARTYRWVEGLELEEPCQRLPRPPDWLLERIAQANADENRVAACSADQANLIPQGQRNAVLARLAGTMRRVGMSHAEIRAALLQTNRDRCCPPVSPAEVERITASVARYEPDQFAVALTELHYEQLLNRPEKVEPLTFPAISSRELDEGEYELEYLINGILVRGQPGVIAGPKKTLKTNLSIDLALSLASGGRFLGHFQAEGEYRVGLMSGESGAATIQETARRIAASQSGRLSNYKNAIWSFTVPQLGQADHIAALRRFITEHRLDVLILDPTYLMMLNIGNDAGNLFAVGSLLKALGDLAQETGCTPLLCHHLKKTIGDPYEPAELDNIAWAGFQEFVRQWVLLNRRVRYDPDQGGDHKLWMSVGGSAGHSGLWGLNIQEGTRQDIAGRRWQVEVLSAADAHAERIASACDEADERKALQKNTKREKQREALITFLTEHPAGETQRLIRESIGASNAVVSEILADLMDEGAVEACTVQKHTRREKGFRLLEKSAGLLV